MDEGGRRRFAPRLFARFGFFVLPLLHFGVVFKLFVRLTLPGAFLQDHFGFGQTFEALLAAGDFVRRIHAFGHGAGVGSVGEREEGLHFGLELRFEFEQAFIRNGLTLGGIRVNFGSIQADVA